MESSRLGKLYLELKTLVPAPYASITLVSIFSTIFPFPLASCNCISSALERKLPKSSRTRLN